MFRYCQIDKFFNLFCHPNDYQLGIQTMHENDIIEIDNLQELAAIDSKYERYLNGGNANE